ncbi:hypothetical protein NE579_16410, partial [Intestinimonas massiliensis]|nr:hypothetical protein [Intestinimonas massiliensis (ex Afouda et al. 2020)]
HPEALTDDQRDVLVALEERPLLADDLVERTQIPARRVLSSGGLLHADLRRPAGQPGKDTVIALRGQDVGAARRWAAQWPFLQSV